MLYCKICRKKVKDISHWSKKHKAYLKAKSQKGKLKSRGPFFGKPRNVGFTIKEAMRLEGIFRRNARRAGYKGGFSDIQDFLKWLKRKR